MLTKCSSRVAAESNNLARAHERCPIGFGGSLTTAAPHARFLRARQRLYTHQAAANPQAGPTATCFATGRKGPISHKQPPPRSHRTGESRPHFIHWAARGFNFCRRRKQASFDIFDFGPNFFSKNGFPTTRQLAPPLNFGRFLAGRGALPPPLRMLLRLLLSLLLLLHLHGRQSRDLQKTRRP